MKLTKILSLLTILVLISVIGVSCKKGKPVVVNPDNPPATEDQAEPPPTYPEIEIIPPFEIIHTTNQERGDLNETLYVLIPAIDLTTKDYLTQVKNLIKKLVVYDKRSEHISILVFDDRASLEKIFLDGKMTDLNIPVHYIARYDGNVEGHTYQFNLIMFPFAPESNPFVKSLNEEIEFDPFKW